MEYNRVMLGKGGMYAAQCLKEGFIGVDFEFGQDISHTFRERWKETSHLLVPIYQANHPEKNRVTAGLSCGYAWTVCYWLKIGDRVLCPNGAGAYLVGEISGAYYYDPTPGAILPHRRPVKWYNQTILRSSMSDNLRHSTGSIGTCCDITKYSKEIEQLLGIPSDYIPSKTKVTPVIATPKPYQERDLHKILCNYVREFQEIYAKTIYHEKSIGKGKDQTWTHPDLVGVEFADLKTDSARSLMRAVNPESAVTIYSFEMKREIHSDNELKEYYFQAVSNSSWANRGYLVAYDIDESLRDEMERLNNAFGIGIIRLQADMDNTEILFQATDKELDFATIDKLCNMNPDFRQFMEKLSKYLHAGKEYAAESKASFEKICDEIFANPSEVEDYCKAHNIPF